MGHLLPFQQPIWTVHAKLRSEKIIFPIFCVSVCACVCAHFPFFTAVLLISSIKVKPRIMLFIFGTET